MIIGCWNIRGLNDPIKHSELRRLIHQERIALFGLVETRVKDKNKDNVSQLLLRSWSFLYNYDFSCRGRIWVCWNADTVKVDVFGMSDQAIHVSVTILATNISFNTSIIYGDNNASLREALWSDIVSRSDGWESTPWILMGDFNAIRNQSDRLGGSTTWAGTMDRLDTCIREAKVDDLRYSGMHYTWSNQCPENLIMRKLDRVLVNEKWNLNFPLSEARFLPSGMSDHSPMVVKVIGNDQNIKKPFRFFDMWMDHDEFMPLVKKVWDQNSGGCPMYQLCCKLRKLKQELKLFNMAHFSNISDKVKDAKNEMDKAQQALHTAHENPILCMRERDAVHKYASTVRAEESFFKQKASIQWLSLGDQNTSYFHKSVNGRQNRNKLLSLTREDGEVVEGHEAVKSEVITYFHRVLGVDQMPRVLNEEVMESAINLKLSSTQQHVLAQDVTREEIKHAMFSLKNNKAPGPDGFNAGFFKRMWHIVGEDVINAVRSFFQTRRMLKEMNATSISLIPKVANPTRLTDFRPISCCNTVYKCIAKILAGRIKVVLPSLVGPYQTAFISGRRISDNILLSQELMKGYHKSTGPARCAMKVDLMKAYDSVRWDFVDAMLIKMGFPRTVIDWIMVCVTSCQFSINVNGELAGYFQGGRGLRQGDPLSPYLFVLCMEILSGLFCKMSANQEFKFH